MKYCPKCQVSQPKENFHKGNGYCKPCKKEYDNKHKANWKFEPYHRINRYKAHLKKRYSMSLEELVVVYDSQGGCCPICNKSLPHPADENGDKWQTNIDHNHACCSTDTTCGKCVRGLLCRDCNLMIGHAKDNLDTLKKAVEYLETTSTKVGTQNLC